MELLKEEKVVVRKLQNKNNEEGLQDKAINQFIRTNPKLRFEENSCPLKFWEEFEVSLSTELLMINAPTILRNCMKRQNVSAFFRDQVSPKQVKPGFNFQILKACFMAQYAGTYWKSTALNRLFAIGYTKGEDIKQFFDRFSSAAHQRFGFSIIRFKEYEGIPEETQNCSAIYCPKCLSETEYFKCSSPKCDFLKVQRKRPHNGSDEFGNRGNSWKMSRQEVNPRDYKNKGTVRPHNGSDEFGNRGNLCRYCKKPFYPGHLDTCEIRKKMSRQEVEPRDYKNKMPFYPGHMDKKMSRQEVDPRDYKSKGIYHKPERFGKVIDLGLPEDKIWEDEEFSMENLLPAFKSIYEEVLGFT